MHLLQSTNRSNPDFLFSLETGTARSYCDPTTSTSTVVRWPSQKRGQRQNQPLATKFTLFPLLPRESKFLNLETIMAEPQREGERSKRGAHVDLGEESGVVVLARRQAQKTPRTVVLPPQKAPRLPRPCDLCALSRGSRGGGRAVRSPCDSCNRRPL